MKICAGIVLYEPDIIRLDQNINAILPQIDLLILVDNGSKNVDILKDKYCQINKIVIISNCSNMGIAYALNQILTRALKMENEWVLLLDQDSICASNIIEEYLKYVYIEQVALITPMIIDLNKQSIKEFKGDKESNFIIIKRSITSGSFLKIASWDNLGPFENQYFIDKVDTEYSMRLNVNGLKQIKCLNTYILHEIGKAERTHLYFLYKCLPNVHTQAWAFRTNHSNIRIYYRSRNTVLLLKKYRNHLNVGFGLMKIVYDSIRQVIIEKNKGQVIKAIARGIKEGINTKIEPYS